MLFILLPAVHRYQISNGSESTDINSVIPSKVMWRTFLQHGPPSPPRLEPPVNPLLATAGRDNLDLRRRVFLRANVVSHK